MMKFLSRKTAADSENTDNTVYKKPPNLIQLFFKELRHDWLALFALVLLVCILLSIFIGAYIIENRHDVMRVNLQVVPVSAADSGTILGIDQLGRDQFHLLFVSARNSLTLSFAVTFFSYLLGMVVGIISGFYGGKVDNIIMRITDTWSMVPFLMIVIVLLQIYGRTIVTFIIFFTLFTWLTRARLFRANALAQRQLDYISASKTLGTRNIVIMFREMLPNLVDIGVANFVLTLAANIGIETGLSMIGYGLGWEHPSLGVMLQRATNPLYLQFFPWVWAPALILVIAIMLCVNFVGNALQRVADPKQRFI